MIPPLRNTLIPFYVRSTNEQAAGPQSLIPSYGAAAAQVESHWVIAIRSIAANVDICTQVTHRGKSRGTAALCLECVDRKRLWIQSAWVADVVGRAAKRALQPHVEHIEHQRRIDR